MPSHHSFKTPVLLSLLAALGLALPVAAQVAGIRTTVEVNVVESTQATLGWSVKNALLDESLYNADGVKLGEIKDLIIAPDKRVSFVIVAAGGFMGFGRHDVAVPAERIEQTQGRLVMAGATRESLEAMPAFAYATDKTLRDDFAAAADRQIASARARVSELQAQSSAATAAARADLDKQIGVLQADLQSADAKVSDLRGASASQWKEHQAAVNAATARLR